MLQDRPTTHGSAVKTIHSPAVQRAWITAPVTRDLALSPGSPDSSTTQAKCQCGTHADNTCKLERIEHAEGVAGKRTTLIEIGARE
jgi:hypothetical protein